MCRRIANLFNFQLSPPLPHVFCRSKGRMEFTKVCESLFLVSQPMCLGALERGRRNPYPEQSLSLIYGQEAMHWHGTWGNGQCVNAYWGLSVSIEIFFLNVYFGEEEAVVEAFARVEIRNVAGKRSWQEQNGSEWLEWLASFKVNGEV